VKNVLLGYRRRRRRRRRHRRGTLLLLLQAPQVHPRPPQ